MGAQLLHGLGVSFDELALRQVESLDEFVYIICRGHLEITSIVAPSLGTLQISYAIHRSTWKWNSANFAETEFSEVEVRALTLPYGGGSTLRAMMPTAEERRLKIGALADQTGLSIKTIRYYEQRGLLEQPPRTAGGYRLYGPETATPEANPRTGEAQDP